MTPNQQYYYEQAEILLAKGAAVVEKIRADAERRDVVGEEWDMLTRRMDERGKQAMGIWAQAQVCATLATIVDVP